MALMGDNHRASLSIGTKIRAPLNGCTTLRFQHAVKEMEEKEEEYELQVELFMAKVRTPLISKRIKENHI